MLKLKKYFHNSTNELIKGIIFLVLILNIIVLFSSYLLANENSVRMVMTNGRAVIIDNNIEQAKKRALDDALYLASLQGGAKINGFSSIDQNTNLKESLVVRPASEIMDFKILEERSNETHYDIKIQAALVSDTLNLNCKNQNIINLSFLKPHYFISGRLPAWSHEFTNIVSNEIYKNLNNLNGIILKNQSFQLVNPSNISNLDENLDYASLTSERVKIKNGDYSVIPVIKLSPAISRLNKFSNELLFEISLNLYKGPNFKFIRKLDYNFSLNIGNNTGYKHIDIFYKTSKDKLIEYTKMSLSKLHFRVLDQLKCEPLETNIIYKNNQILVPIGTNQGLRNGNIGLVSISRNLEYSAKDWSVLTVVSTNKDYSILETLNPNIDGNNLEGKFIRFLN